MLRYNNIGFGMEIGLPRINEYYKGYSIICQCELKDSKVSSRDYKVSLWLKYENIDTLSSISCEPLYFNDIDAKELKLLVCQEIERMFEAKEFNEAIDNYEYMLACFDAGDDVLSGGNKSA